MALEAITNLTRFPDVTCGHKKLKMDRKCQCYALEGQGTAHTFHTGLSHWGLCLCVTQDFNVMYLFLCVFTVIVNNVKTRMRVK